MLCISFLFWYIAHNWNYGILATPSRTIVKIHLNSLETPAMKDNKTNSLGLTHTPAISQKNQKPKTITQNEEKIAFVLFMAGGFAIWNMFR